MFRILGHFLTFEYNMKPFVSKNYRNAIVFSVVKRILWMGLALLQTFSPLTSPGFSLLQCDAFCFLLRLERKSLLCGFSHPFTPHQSHQKEWRENIILSFFCTISFNCKLLFTASFSLHFSLSPNGWNIYSNPAMIMIAVQFGDLALLLNTNYIFLLMKMVMMKS